MWLKRCVYCCKRNSNCWSTNDANKRLIFKNNENNTFIDNAEDLNIVMHIYNLLVYSSNYSMTSGSLWNFNRNEVNKDANENSDAGNYIINNSKTATSKSFEYKMKIIGGIPSNNNTLDTEPVVPLKYLSNFWRFLDFPLINCEIELDS